MSDKFRTLFSKRPPPPPGTSALLPVHGQQVVEEFYFQDKGLRQAVSDQVRVSTK